MDGIRLLPNRALLLHKGRHRRALQGLQRAVSQVGSNPKCYLNVHSKFIIHQPFPHASNLKAVVFSFNSVFTWGDGGNA